MGTATSFSSIRDWVSLFFLYGPFFITLFIMIYGIRQAKGALDKAETTKPRDPDALKLYRRIYVAVWMFSALLVIACCWWWFQNYSTESDKKYVLRLDVTDAQPSDRLEPNTNGFFVRTSDAADIARRRDEFVFVKDKPFEEGEEIEIVHKKGVDAMQALKYPIRVAEIDKKRGSAYKLVFEDGKYSLVSKSAGTKPHKDISDLLGIGVAQAQTAKSIVGKPFDLRSAAPLSAPNINAPPPAGVLVTPSVVLSAAAYQDHWTSELSQARQSISRQIEALDALAEKAAKGGGSLDLLRPVPNAQSKGETLLSQLMYLSKHQDKLVAYKARKLLDQLDYLTAAAKAASSAGTATEVQRQILIALTEREWEQIAKRVPTNQKAGFDQQQRLYGKAASPLPSATAEGTKYFAVVTWPALNDSQNKCLAEKIYRQNIDAASLADQLKEINRLRTIGMVFDSRAEAAFFADGVKNCGAKTDFVYNGDKRLVALGK